MLTRWISKELLLNPLFHRMNKWLFESFDLFFLIVYYWEIAAKDLKIKLFIQFVVEKYPYLHVLESF